MAAKGTCPTSNDWCGTLTLGEEATTVPGFLSQEIGYNQAISLGGINPAEFTHGDTTYTVTTLVIVRHTTFADVITRADLSISMDGAELPYGTVLNVEGEAFTVDADSDTTQLAQEKWDLLALGLSFNWAEGGEVAVSANLPPGLDTAIVDGASLVQTYHEDLDTGSVPAASAYSVVVDGGTGTAPSSVSVSGKTVTLTLASAVESGQVVTVTYTVPTSNPLQDASGHAAVALTGQAVTNDTDNTHATGLPAITGAAQAGKTLTATVGTIADADGLPTFPDDYTFQWVRVDADGSSNETNIGSDSDTYTLVTADVGKKIRLKVSFTDNGSTAEGPLTSDAYPSYANVMAAKGTCPTGNDWCATLTLGEKASTTAVS